MAIRGARIALAAVSLVVAALLVEACGAGGVFRQYEYEEDMYLALDGTASVYVNSSVSALDALRGATLDAASASRPDRNATRAFFETPITHVVGRVTTSSRRGRQFVHVRVDVQDVTRLAEAGPFAWSTYRFGRDGDLFVYKQTVGPPAGKSVPANWTGDEIVAFRLHLPSKVEWHNATPGQPMRGNILVWEQPLADRLKGVPLAFETRVQTQSILYRALWLFGLTGLAVAVMFALLIWAIVRRGARTASKG